MQSINALMQCTREVPVLYETALIIQLTTYKCSTMATCMRQNNDIPFFFPQFGIYPPNIILQGINSHKCTLLCWKWMRHSGVLTEAPYIWQDSLIKTFETVNSLSFTSYECNATPIASGMTTIIGIVMYYMKSLKPPKANYGHLNLVSNSPLPAIISVYSRRSTLY